MQKLLEVRNLTKIFTLGSFVARAKIVAVEKVSFSIAPGEIFTIAGESGCGKTTTARIILGFEYPTWGEVLYRGQNLQYLGNRRTWFKEVQAVFQNPFETFNPLKKVENYFFATVYNYGLAKTRAQAQELIEDKLKAVGLAFAEIEGKYPGELSGGQLQRASIARSLLTNPSLLVADEPVSMVDASLRMSIVNLFRKLRDTFGVSIIYITHDLATAYYMSDRIAIMLRGNIVEMGTPEILVQPRHPYTRILLHSVPKPDPEAKDDAPVQILEEQEEYLLEGCKFAGRCPEALAICKHRPPQEKVYSDGTMVRCHRYS